ncbi:MAG: tetratricopeptide repeat protein [Candidatus Heimdallarchaeota archaeon]
MGTKSRILVKEIEADYTGRNQIRIYRDESDNWIITFVTIDKRTKEVVDQFSESQVKQINEEEIVQIISESGLGISSISAIYALSEKILEVLLQPEESMPVLAENTSSEEVKEGVISIKEEIAEVEPIEALEPEMEAPEIDLASLRKPEDVALYIQKMKAAMDHAKPVLVGEIEVPYSQGSRAQIYRKGDSDEWWITFESASKESLTGLLPLPSFDVDSMAKVINQGIPSISLSAVYDASEKVLKDINKLEERGTDDAILSQAVLHFTKVIEEHEEVGEYDEARALAEALLKTFTEMNNAVGVKEFSLRIVKYLELKGVEGVEEALDVVDENLEVLFNIQGSGKSTQQYINACSAFLNAHGMQDRAIDLQYELANWLIKNDEALAAAEYVKKIAKHYEKLGLIERLIEITADFGKKLLETGTEEEALLLLDECVKILEEKKQYIALVDLLGEVVQTIKGLVEQSSKEDRDTVGVKREYRTYAEKAVLYYQQMNQNDASLEVLLWLFKNMMNEISYEDALKYVDQSLEICEHINDLERYVTISLNAADALFDIKSKETRTKAIDYVVQAAHRMKRSIQLIKSLKRYHSKFIEVEDLPGAKRLVDNVLEFLAEKTDIGSFKTAATISLDFSTSLFEKKANEMGLDYLKLSGDYYGRAMATDEFIPIGLERAQQFINQKNIRPAVELVNLVIQNYEFSKDYKKATKLLSDFADQLFPEYLEAAIEFVHKLVQLTDTGFGDSEAIKVALKYRDRWKDQERAAVECTRAALNVIIERGSDYIEAVQIIRSLIDKILINTKAYEEVLNWVMISQKFAKHAEDFDSSIEVALKYRDRLLKESPETAAQLTTVILQLVYQEGHVERAGDLSNYFAIKLTELKQFDLATYYAQQAANLYYQKPGVQVAVERLFNLITELQKNPEGIQPSEKLMDWILTVVERSYSKKEAADWSNWFLSEMIRLEEIVLANKYATLTIQYYIASDLTETALNVALNQTDEVLKYGLFDKAVEFLTSAITILSSKDPVKVKDIALKYTETFLIAKDWSVTSKLADITIKKLKNELELVGEFCSKFTAQLLAKGFELKLARKYTDEVRTAYEVKGDSLSLLAAAALCLDFAVKARNEGDLDLAKEYSNEASNYQSKAGDNLSAAETLETLADVLEEAGDFQGSIRYLNRAIILYEMAGADHNQLLKIYHSLFNKQIGLKDFYKAEQTCDKIVQMVQKEDNPQESRKFLLIAVDRFRQSGQLRQAVKKFESLYSLSEELDMLDRRLLGELKILGEDLKRSKDSQGLEWFKKILNKIAEKIAEEEAKGKAKAEAEAKIKERSSSREEVHALPPSTKTEITEEVPTEKLEVVDEPPELQIPVPPVPKVMPSIDKEVPEHKKPVKSDNDKIGLPEEAEEEVKVASKKPPSKRKTRK